MMTGAVPPEWTTPVFIHRSPGYPWQVALQQSLLPFTRPAKLDQRRMPEEHLWITHHPFCPLLQLIIFILFMHFKYYSVMNRKK